MQNLVQIWPHPRVYRWQWVATLAGVEIGRGIREKSEGEFFDEYGTTNLPGLIERWNAYQVEKAPDGCPNIKWTYTQIF